jgi:hypothetical protein
MTELDANYLKDTVGDILAEALANVAIQQPADPVEFVGLYLLNHVKNQKKKSEVCICYFYFNFKFSTSGESYCRGHNKSGCSD